MGLQVLRVQKLSGLNGLFLVFIGKVCLTCRDWAH